MRTWKRPGRQALAGLLCLSLLVWSILPQLSHVPGIAETLQEQAQMVAEHGHSHGLGDDLYRALHGHGHDADHHDHSHALVAPRATSDGSVAGRDVWPLGPAPSGPSHQRRIDRPPRA